MIEAESEKMKIFVLEMFQEQPPRTIHAGKFFRLRDVPQILKLNREGYNSPGSDVMTRVKAITKTLAIVCECNGASTDNFQVPLHSMAKYLCHHAARHGHRHRAFLISRGIWRVLNRQESIACLLLRRISWWRASRACLGCCGD